MLKDIVAKRYAKALLSLALDSRETEAVKKDLSAVAELYKNSRNLQSVIMNPIFGTKDKSSVLKGLASELKVSSLSARFMDMLIEKGRFRYIREVAAAYSDLLDQHAGRVKATVTSASPLTDAEVAKLGEKIKAAVGKNVELKVSSLSARFMDMLIEKGRFRYIREVASAYSDLLDQHEGRVKATVTSASPLTDAEVAKLSEKIKAAVGKSVELKVEVDPALIGGIRTRIGSTVYDGSIQNQVRLVREALIK